MCVGPSGISFSWSAHKGVYAAVDEVTQLDSHDGNPGSPDSVDERDELDELDEFEEIAAPAEIFQALVERLATVQPLRARLLVQLRELIVLVREARARDSLTVEEEDAVAKLIVDLRTLLDAVDQSPGPWSDGQVLQ
jgi:hypothetical protein